MQIFDIVFEQKVTSFFLFPVDITRIHNFTTQSANQKLSHVGVGGCYTKSIACTASVSCQCRQVIGEARAVSGTHSGWTYTSSRGCLSL